jgi:hypothetical protein
MGVSTFNRPGRVISFSQKGDLGIILQAEPVENGTVRISAAKIPTSLRGLWYDDREFVSGRNLMASILHDRLANTALLFCFFMAVWGFWRFFRKNGVNSSYWGAAIIAEVLVLLQGGIGLYLWITGLRPERGWIHILYGISLALAVPIVYSYTRGKQDRPEMLLYAVAFLIMCGLVLRAMVTGG